MKNIILLVSLFMFNCSCATLTNDKYHQITDDHDAITAQEMMRKTVKIRHKIKIEMTSSGLFEDPNTPKQVATKELEGSGSGVIINSDYDNDSSLILTAWHVCDTLEEGKIIHGLFADIRVLSTVSEVLTYDSKVLDYKVVAKIRDNDTCVLKTEGSAGEAAELATSLPPHGAIIQASGAPKGVWGRYNVYIEDGRYLGVYSDDLELELSDNDNIKTRLSNFLYFSIPGAPGISGGPIWYRGKVIALYNIGSGAWGHAGFGPNLGMLNKVLDEARANI